MRVVEWLVAIAHVDVEERERMAGEPAGLEGKCTTFQRPFSAVR